MWLHGPQKSPQRPAVSLQQPPPRAASRDDFVEDGGGAPRSGRRSMVSADGKEEEASAELPIPSTSPQRPQQQPKQMRQRDPLLASLDSLSAFAYSHRGRLGRTVEQREGGGGGNEDLEDGDPQIAVDPRPAGVTTDGSAPRNALDGSMDGTEHAQQFQKCLRPTQLAVPPQLPRGRQLRLELLSTWGDAHYIGLAAVQLWDEAGRSLCPSDPARQLHAEPVGVHALPGLQDDPRTAAKLFDGVLATCDSFHMWLAPFSPGKRHTLTVTLDRPASLARMRLWNYNASRAHAQRGARHFEARLDGVLISSGELARATGSMAGAADHATTVCFSDDPQALSPADSRSHAPACDDYRSRASPPL